LANFVNNKRYDNNHIFEIISVKDNEAYTTGFTDESHVGNLQFKDLEHGMMLKDGTIVKKIQSLKTCNKDSFYFLHIAKTSGISLQEELKNVFQDRQLYINNIQYINESDMLASKFISGHFATYPFDLFKKNNKKIHGITLIRNPIDRAISCFIFMNKIFDVMLHKKTDSLTSKNFDNFLSEPKNLEFINNFQSRSIVSGLDESKAEKFSNLYIDRSIDRFQLLAIMTSNCNFIAPGNNGNSWKDGLDKFDIIGSVDSRDLFLDKLSNILEKNKYPANIRNVKKNQSDFKVEEIKKMLTKDQINRIIELNEYDFEFYDYVMTNKGVWEC
jgi:hypothetical protein